MVDYRKWDKLSLGDDSSDDENPGSKKVAAFVKLHPEDSGEGLPPIFLTDPRTFKPFVDEAGKVSSRWGLPLDDVTEPMARMSRRLKAQFLYRSSRPSPQEQFLGMLVKAEREKLAAALALAGTNGLAETLLSDLILKVSLRGTKPLVWRRVRVAAALKPHFNFQDRVLGRWAGSATTHGFYFTDLADGS